MRLLSRAFCLPQVQHNVSGLAVVNEKGELVDNISVRDLRGCGGKAENWTNLSALTATTHDAPTA